MRETESLGQSGSKDGLTIGVDERVYPLDAVVKAGYAFLSRCYIFLFHNAEGVLQVRIKAKRDEQTNLPLLVDEFLNELLNQSTRLRVARETSDLRELIMARALYNECLDMGTPPSRPPEADDTRDTDPLGIGTDWFGRTPGPPEHE